MPHTPKLFLNLPVTDVPRATAFYTALGFTLNPQFSNETGSCIVMSEHNYVMLLAHSFFDTFIAKPRGDASAATGALYAIDCESRSAVDAMVAAAVANGGTQPLPAKDHGFMYQWSFQDPDGHHWEPFWMDPAAG
jgi:uncharacterized protein